MTIQEIADAIRNITENSVTKLRLESWISLEVGRIINKKKYWWRKAPFTFDCVAAAPTVAAPDDFLQAASSLFEFHGTTKIAELPYIADSFQQLQMLKDTTSGQPTAFTLDPGTTKTFRLSPIPDMVRSYALMYYRGAQIKWTSPTQEIPLIPPEFHYVAYQAMERRAFFYMYGQKDPRAVLSAQAEKECLADLDDYKSPSTVTALEWRSSDPDSFVQSTR